MIFDNLMKTKFPNLSKDMTILTIADTHDTLKKDTMNVYLNDTSIDMIVLLGDISFNDWMLLLSNENFLYLPKYGVLGNHDNLTDLDMVNEKIRNMNQKRFREIYKLEGTIYVMNMLSFTGLNGSIKYKNLDVPMYTQKEALDVLSKIEEDKIDILFSHDKSNFKVDTSDKLSKDSHCGLYAIYKFMKDHHCYYNIHGHIHEPYTKQVDHKYHEFSLYKLNLLKVTKKGITILK